MKLKQIVFNSLPRPKSKKKKKQNDHATKPVVQAEVTRGAVQSGLQGDPSTNAGPLSDNQQTNNRRASSKTDKAVTTQGLTGTTPDFAVTKVDKSPLDQNLNSRIEAKCACYKHFNRLEDNYRESHRADLWSGSDHSRDAGYSSVSSSAAEDSGFSSLPKTRTRIKTNPWFPSPRSTPSTSPDVSPMGSSTPSPVYSEHRGFERPNNLVAGRTPLPSTPELNIPCQPEPPPCRQTHDDTDNDSLLQRSFLSESDNGSTDILMTTDDNSLPDKEEALGGEMGDWSGRPEVDSPSLLSPSSSSSSDSSADNDGGVTNKGLLLPVTHVSFQYEEAFESQLEAPGVGRFVSSRDDLSDGSANDLFNDPLGSRAHDFDSECCGSGYDSSANDDDDNDLNDGRSGGSETETDDTVCDDYYTATGFRGNGRPSRFNDPFRDFYKHADNDLGEENDDEVGDADCESYDEFDAVSFGSPQIALPYANDRGMRQAEKEPQGQSCCLRPLSAQHEQYPMATNQTGVTRVDEAGSGRSLDQVRTSLHEKVSRLRQEKLIVDERIREAREEEQLRRAARLHLQQQVALHRKQLLLRTLEELRCKLEDQSERLQQTYSAVLCMQQAVIWDRQQRQVQRPVAINDTREAPF